MSKIKTTHFIYDGAKLIGEYNSDGTPKNEYIYLDGTPLAVTNATQTLYIHTDHLGTPRRLADENGAIVWSWESEPFGESKAVGIVEFNLRFAGQYFDDETSTHYNINRDYDPKMGRYVQSDPIGFDGGVNSYGYVGGNPMGSVDELGLRVGILRISPTPIAYNTPYKHNDVSLGRQIIDLCKNTKLVTPNMWLAGQIYDWYKNPIKPAGRAKEPAPYQHDEENDALNEPGGNCNSIKWAIKVLEANIAWRYTDLNPSDGKNYQNHLKRIRILEKALERLKGIMPVFVKTT